MDKRTVFAEGLVLARALKVLDRGILVGEPPNLWLMRDTDGDLKADTKELVTDQFGRRAGECRAQRQRLDVGARQLDLHVRSRHLPSPEKRKIRRAEDSCPRAMGPVAGRRRAHISAIRTESALHVDLVPTPYFFRNPEPSADAGELRVPRRRQQSQHGVADSSDTRREPRLSGRRAARRMARSHPLPPLPRRPCIRGIVCPPISTATSSLSNRARISSAASSSPTMGRRCEAGRLTRTPSSWPRRTSVSGPFISRPHLTARCTWSTCIAASSSTVATSPSICGIRSSRESSNSRDGRGRIYRVVHETTSATSGHRCRPRPQHASSRRSRIRTAGGGTRPSVCWSSVATSRSSGRCKSWRPVRRSREPGCTRCGPWMASTRSNPQWCLRRSVTRRETSACPRCVWPSAGCASRNIQSTPRS